MGDTLPRFTAAAVQATPIFLDREATIDKACELIADAGDAGADLIVFPETWVPGYPFWHTTPGVFSGDTFAELWKNAVEIPSLATARLARGGEARARVRRHRHQRARLREPRHDVTTRLLYLSPDGEIAHNHRKLMPTFTERTIWGFGDGSDLRVLDTPLGRIGGLICWEHEMTLAKYALYAQGEQVHCATWPAYTGQNNHIDFGTRQYAFEGACFVVSACGVVTPGAMPEHLGGDRLRANGGSAIIAPNGDYLAGPVYDCEEILYAEIDLEVALSEKHSHDVAGSYARPDVFQLLVNAEPKPIATFNGHTSDGLDLDVRLEAATAEEVVDRLEAVREYLGSLIERIESDGDSEVNEAIAEALASIDMAAAGMWSNK